MNCVLFVCVCCSVSMQVETVELFRWSALSNPTVGTAHSTFVMTDWTIHRMGIYIHIYIYTYIHNIIYV